MKPAADHLSATLFDAPRELVFEVWTVAEHFARWFGPRAAETAFCTIDPRPGGVIQFCHQSADGVRLWAKGAFQRSSEVASLDSVAFERRLARRGWAEVFDTLAEHLVVAARGTRSST
jgi:hypothetical protein